MSEALHVLTPGLRAANDVCQTAIRNVHALIEDAPRHQLGILARAEAFQNQAALLGGRFVGDLWHAEPPAHLLDQAVELAEDQHALVAMACAELFEQAELGGRAARGAPPPAPGPHAP